jgi:hypothetical protein
VTDSDFRQARLAFLADGRVSEPLVILLRSVVRRMVAFGSLPPMYSPTGKWDEDAEDEVFADWVAARLVGTGQLAALMHQAGTARSFVRLAELYLRRHLINRLERSHATNLFGRLRALLPEEEDLFRVVAASEREQDVVWGLASQEAVRLWGGSEERLMSLAWALGEFETVRYREDARKLSPVLERDELLRFVTGLMEAAAAGLTLAQIVRVIVRRFDLEPATIEGLGDEATAIPAADNVIEQVEAAQLSVAALAELSGREVDVLRCQLLGLSVRDIAEQLGLSTGTVSNEQRVIGSVLSRLSDPDGQSRMELLNALRDLLF